MKSLSPNFELLFGRLEWPSLMVRERAATQIVILLEDPAFREVIGEALVAWLSSRKLEILTANLLLLPLRLKADGLDVFPGIDRLAVANHYPSALSHLLMAELSDNWKEPARWQEWHSGTAPNSFTMSSYFERFERGFVPPIYEIHAKEIENNFLLPFQRQWAYEWERIIKRTNLPLSGPPFYFVRGYDKTYVQVDVPQSEAYRSAYLRALAWAVDIGELPPDLAQVRALECCPVDVGVWKITPSNKPVWWPRADIGITGLDTTPGQVWQQVEALWKDQQRGTSKQLLAHASGLVFSNETSVCDLEIHSMFQRFEDKQNPQLEDVVDWLSHRHRNFPIQMRATLGGPIRPEPIDAYRCRFAGWSLVPTTFRVEGWTTPRWQIPQLYRGLWTVAPYLVDRECELLCDNVSLKLQNGKHQIAQWQAWHDGLEERWYADVPPATGEWLWMDQDLVGNFGAKTKSNFCWIVRLKFYHRQRSSESFKLVTDIRTFGESNIIR